MALQLTLTNPYRPLGAQTVTAYAVARVERLDTDARRCLVILAAYDGPCTKADRAAGTIKPFDAYARAELIHGALFEQYFSTEAMAGSNLTAQAYLCAKHTILDADGQETNAWAAAVDC